MEMTITIEKILSGDVQAVSRLIRMIDDNHPAAVMILKQLFPHTGKAAIIGLTGPPGAGKSTLTNQLIRSIRKQQKTVGVLAVDPSSPFTGGAILGDRIRMQEHFNDEGVFIRSMASRGEFGGITSATRGAITVLDTMGKDYILVETVGVGQDEIDIARVADTTVIVLAPGLGDTIQTLKAGILEVGDILVVNKADKPDANVAIAELKAMVALGISTNPGTEDWQPMVVPAIANTSQGISELWSAIETRLAYLSREPSPNYKKRRFWFHKLELVDLVKRQFMENILKDLNQKGRLDDYVTAIIKKEIDPYTASEQILAYLSKES